MTIVRNSGQPVPGYFASPSALRQYAIETATQLRQAGLSEAGGIMELAAKFVTSSGSEWLGERGAATKTIQNRFDLSDWLRSRVARIGQASASKHPDG
jgi:hypothetical protein